MTMNHATTNNSTIVLLHIRPRTRHRRVQTTTTTTRWRRPHLHLRSFPVTNRIMARRLLHLRLCSNPVAAAVTVSEETPHRPFPCRDPLRTRPHEAYHHHHRLNNVITMCRLRCTLRASRAHRLHMRRDMQVTLALLCIRKVNTASAHGVTLTANKKNPTTKKNPTMTTTRRKKKKKK